MSSVKVAVRVRPFNSREREVFESKCIISMSGNTTSIVCKHNAKFLYSSIAIFVAIGTSQSHSFNYDYSYWSVDSQDAHFIGQKQVYEDLGVEVSNKL